MAKPNQKSFQFILIVLRSWRPNFGFIFNIGVRVTGLFIKAAEDVVYVTGVSIVVALAVIADSLRSEVKPFTFRGAFSAYFLSAGVASGACRNGRIEISGCGAKLIHDATGLDFSFRFSAHRKRFYISRFSGAILSIPL